MVGKQSCMSVRRVYKGLGTGDFCPDFVVPLALNVLLRTNARYLVLHTWYDASLLCLGGPQVQRRFVAGHRYLVVEGLL